MKKYLPLLFFLVSLQSFSQTDFRFADSTAQWNVLSAQWCMGAPCASFQTMVYQVKVDTTINQLKYQIVSLSATGIPSYFLRKDSLQKTYAFAHNDSVEHLLYDFGLNANDTVRVSGIAGNGIIFTTLCRVVRVDSIMLNRLRKKIVVSYYPDDTIYMQDTWIEGIGSVHTHFLTPGIDPQSMDGPKEDLLCFFENDSLIYHGRPMLFAEADTSECLMNLSWTGASKIKAENKIQISPNPATASIKIQSESNFPSNTSFQLFDLTGRMVLQKEISDKTSRMDLNEVSKGMYLYHVSSGGRRIASGKLVVE